MVAAVWAIPLLVIVLGWVFLPLITGASDSGDQELQRSEQTKAILAQVRDLEMDLSLGRVDQEEFDRRKAQFVRQIAGQK